MTTALYILAGLATLYLAFYTGCWIGYQEMKYSVDEHIHLEAAKISNKRPEAHKPKQNKQTYECSKITRDIAFTDRDGNLHEARIFPN